jgi:dihydrofolate reductase
LRKIIAFLATSLDGFIARPDGGVEWLFTDGDYGMSQFFRSIDTLLIGRKTYEVARQLGGSPSYPGVKAYVFSRTLAPGEHPGVEIVAGDVGEFARRLRRRKGKHIWMMGGGELIESFLKAGQIDEFKLAVHPIVLGAGIPLFRAPRASVPLKLLACKPYPSGLVILHYAVQPRALRSRAAAAARAKKSRRDKGAQRARKFPRGQRRKAA